MQENSFEKLPITIEQATLADRDAYKKIRLEALDKEPEAFGGKLEDEEKRPDEKWENDLKEKYILLLKQNNESIGLSKMNMRKVEELFINPVDIGEKEVGFITSVYVRAEKRSKGSGRKMLNNLENEIRKHGGKKAVLYVSKINKDVREFYQKSGYSFNEDLIKYDKWEGMEKDLK